MCILVHIDMSAQAWREQTLTLDRFLKPEGISSLHLPTDRTKGACCHTLLFILSARNLSLRTCVANTLLTEPQPQPLCLD